MTTNISSNHQPSSVLELCAQMQMSNTLDIANIGNRLNALLHRLNGRSVQVAKTGSEEDSSSNGMLNDLLSNLEIESGAISSVSADLDLLERLL